MKRTWPIVFLVCLLIVSGCKRRPENVMSDSKMASLWADLEIAAVLAAKESTFGSDSSKKVLRQAIMAQHKVTEEEYQATMDYYGHDLAAYNEMLAKAQKNVQGKLKGAADGSPEEIKVEGTGLWPYSTTLVILPYSKSEAVSFDIETDKLEKGGSFIWKMRMNQKYTVQFIIGAEYTDGTIGYLNQSQGGKEKLDLRFQSDSSKVVKKIFGRLASKDSNNPLFLDSISLSIHKFEKDAYNTIFSQKLFKEPVKKVVADSIAHAFVKDTLQYASKEKIPRPRNID